MKWPDLCLNDSTERTTCQPKIVAPCNSIISNPLHQNATRLIMNVYSPPSSVLGESPKMDKRKSNNYKALKESFVSNLSGGSIWEINEVSFVLPVSILKHSARSMGSMLTTLGWCSALVRTSVSTAFLLALYPCSSCHRFPHQLRLSTLRYYCLLQPATAAECFTSNACNSRSHQPANTQKDFSTATSNINDKK